MKRTQRVIAKEDAVTALKYAIKLIKNDMAVHDLELDSEEGQRMIELVKLKKAFKKGQQIIMT